MLWWKENQADDSNTSDGDAREIEAVAEDDAAQTPDAKTKVDSVASDGTDSDGTDKESAEEPAEASAKEIVEGSKDSSETPEAIEESVSEEPTKEATGKADDVPAASEDVTTKSVDTSTARVEEPSEVKEPAAEDKSTKKTAKGSTKKEAPEAGTPTKIKAETKLTFDWGVSDLKPESMPHSIWAIQGVQGLEFLASEEAVYLESELHTGKPQEVAETLTETPTVENPVGETNENETVSGTADQAKSEEAATEEMPTFMAPIASTMPDVFVSDAASGTTETPVEPVKFKVPLREASDTDSRSRGLVTAIVSALSVVLVLVGISATGFFFFESHAKPGTQLAGHNIGGFSEAQIRDVAANIAKGYQVSFDHEGEVVSAKPKDLGITFDYNKTVSQVMSSSSNAGVAMRYNPFKVKAVPMAMTINQLELEDYLNGFFVAEEDRSVPAGVTFSAEAGHFVLVPGIEGTQIDAVQASKALNAGEGTTDPIKVVTTTEPPRVLDEDAQVVVDEANARLNNAPYLVGNGKEYWIPWDRLATWMIFTPDIDSGTIDIGIDEEKIAAELPELLAGHFTQPMIEGEQLIRPDGGVLITKRAGKNGTRVEDPSAAVAGVVAALTEGKQAAIPVNIVVHEHTSKRVPMEDKYLVPNGAKWAEVNLTTRVVTRWEGTTYINEWPVVIGAPGTPTVPGVHRVWLKVRSQNMSGPGYSIDGVPWIAYFDGDRAFHGNWWASPGRAASHGCVGLTIDRAKVMFDWIEYGTMVIVHN
ncbi:MAG: L,D-transpeptidase family protein [Propionibacteriaceae bacterium]|jgi:lipoprotein-anchoring transpeptidase ErfK/SrfK/uncharacterized protein (DUF2267 family)|nr:L,D-transpeptidase family protein [Propionibacteriaceae bacterium]